MPLVSILSSIHNENDSFLKEFLDSCISQTLTEWELILVDDGASDSNVNVINCYNDKRIKFVRKENMGLTKSLNYGCKFISGEYIARLDTDDYMHPERLRKQVEFLDKHNEHLLVGTEDLEVYPSYCSYNFSKEMVSDEIANKLRIGNPLAHSTLMFRAAAFKKVGQYDESFYCAQDYDLLVRMSQLGKMFKIGEPLVYRHISENQISFKKLREQTYNAIRVKKNILIKQGASLVLFYSLAKSIFKFLILFLFSERGYLKVSKKMRLIWNY